MLPVSVTENPHAISPRWVLLMVLILTVGVQLPAQENIAFDFTSTRQETISRIFINQNFNKVDAIPVDINKYHNLIELTFWPQQSELHPDTRNVQEHNRIIDIETTDVNEIPTEIGACSKLQILRISQGNNLQLPESMTALTSLQTLELPGTTNLDEQMPVLLSLESLHRLQCFRCDLSDSNRHLLLEEHPDLMLVISDEDLFQAVHQENPTHRVWLGEHFSYVFDKAIDARMFYESTPDEERTFYKMTLE